MNPLLTIDVAHPPRHPDVVEQQLMDASSKVRNSATLRVLKIVHGHGSSGKGGSTKDVVRNWAFRNKARIRATIDGERYNVYETETGEMRNEVGTFSDPDLDNGNPGVTILWIK